MPWYQWVPLWGSVLTPFVLAISVLVAWCTFRETFGVIIDWEIIRRWKLKNGQHVMGVKLKNVGKRRATIEFEDGENINIQPGQTKSRFLPCGSDFRYTIKCTKTAKNSDSSEIIDGFGDQDYVRMYDDKDLDLFIHAAFFNNRHEWE